MVLEHLRPLFNVFVEAFEIPSKILSDGAAEVRRFTIALINVDQFLLQIEAHSIPAFLELVIKLNEAAFRPLFRKLYDWAFADDSGE